MSRSCRFKKSNANLFHYTNVFHESPCAVSQTFFILWESIRGLADNPLNVFDGVTVTQALQVCPMNLPVAMREAKRNIEDFCLGREKGKM